MTAKKYLNQARHLDKLINAKVRCIAGYKKDIGILQSPKLVDKVQHSSDNASSVRIVEKIVDLEKELDNDIDKLVDLKREIISKIDALQDNLQKTILIDYYINTKTFEDIAYDEGYSKRQIIRIYNKSIKIFERCHQMSLNVTL